MLTRVGADDWPAGDGTIYDRSAFECGPVLTDQRLGVRPMHGAGRSAIHQAEPAHSCWNQGMQHGHCAQALRHCAFYRLVACGATEPPGNGMSLVSMNYVRAQLACTCLYSFRRHAQCQFSTDLALYSAHALRGAVNGGDSCCAGLRRRFVHKPLDFGQFMEVVAATGADPYLVLNYDSANKPSADPADSWGYDKLRDATESWVAYIVRKGYQVIHAGTEAGDWGSAMRLLGLPCFAQQSAVQPERTLSYAGSTAGRRLQGTGGP